MKEREYRQEDHNQSINIIEIAMTINQRKRGERERVRALGTKIVTDTKRKNIIKEETQIAVTVVMNG